MTFTRAELLLLVAGMNAAKNYCSHLRASVLPAFLVATEREWSRKRPLKSGSYKRTLFALLIKLDDLGEDAVQAIIEARARFREHEGVVNLERTWQ
jgi:hypothetical protein